MKNTSVIAGLTRNPLNMIAIFFLALATCGCTDWLDLRPNDGAIEEDFWKKQSDVESVVAACYRAMQEDGFMGSIIVNGEGRSDNVITGKSTPEGLQRVMDAIVLSSNDYAKWESFYVVINYCNTIIEKAPQVSTIDPNYTKGFLNAHLAEAYTLRALCYFYLVRIWGDVPFIDFAYTEDTQEFNIPKVKSVDVNQPGDSICHRGDAILTSVSKDLEWAETYALKTRTSMSQNKGRITKSAVRAILADIYLWQGKYQECIDACDRVLVDVVDNLDAIPSNERLGSELALLTNKETPTNAFYMLYLKNSYESIFELQFIRSVKDNVVVRKLYGTPQETEPGVGHFAAAISVFNNAKIWTPSAISEPDDVREKDSYMELAASDAAKPSQIFKYIGVRRQLNTNGTSSYFNMYDHETWSPNWIIYRLSDMYLMKAEALVERSGAPEDLEEALRLVNLIYLRSNPNVVGGFPEATQAQMRSLVLEERQREFLFEGKRWFDLLRFARREGSSETMLTKYLMRKFDANSQASIKSRLLNMDALYMPIHKTELTRNTALVQNSYYSENEK